MELETSVVCVSQKDNSVVVVANDFSSVHTGANFLFVRKLPKITFPLKISFQKALQMFEFSPPNIKIWDSQ